MTLQKTVEHIGKLQQDRQQLQEEVRRLREEIEELSTSIKYVPPLRASHPFSDTQMIKTFLFPPFLLLLQSQLVSGTAACNRGARQAGPL